MSWMLFDERGVRAQKLTIVEQFSLEVFEGWGRKFPEEFCATEVLGFSTMRDFIPTWFAAKMVKGYRVFPVSTALAVYHRYVTSTWMAGARHSASPDHKRFPNIGSLEVYLRTISA